MANNNEPKTSDVKTLVTQVYTEFYKFEVSRSILTERSEFKNRKDLPTERKQEALDLVCGKLVGSRLNMAQLYDESRFIVFDGNKRIKKPRDDSEDDKLVFRIESRGGSFTVSTGLYCGVISLGGTGKGLPDTLRIETGFSDPFLRRMLNFSCGIYIDKTSSSAASKGENIYGVMIQYMYLLSLRKAVERNFPKKYRYPSDRGYSVNGNVDINAFVNHDLLCFDKKITFIRPEHRELQSVIDVLYAAFKTCDPKNRRNRGLLPDANRVETFLMSAYSGRRPQRGKLTRVLQEPLLNNGLYSDFKKPLQLAKILLEHDDITGGKPNSKESMSGYLIDVSYLWEQYLEKIMRDGIGNEWEIDAQHEHTYYEGSPFLETTNRPDFVLINRKTHDLYVLDAKFKRMNYNDPSKHAQNNDLRQVHAYGYYYHLNGRLNGGLEQYNGSYKFRGVGLVFPSDKPRAESDEFIFPLFGIEKTEPRMAVLTVCDPYVHAELDDKGMRFRESEAAFIKDLNMFLNPQAASDPQMFDIE